MTSCLHVWVPVLDDEPQPRVCARCAVEELPEEELQREQRDL